MGEDGVLVGILGVAVGVGGVLVGFFVVAGLVVIGGFVVGAGGFFVMMITPAGNEHPPGPRWAAVRWASCAMGYLL